MMDDKLILKIEPDLKEALRQYAEANHTNMSQAVRIILRRELDPHFGAARTNPNPPRRPAPMNAEEAAQFMVEIEEEDGT